MCTCGLQYVHQIAERTSADGAKVRFWSDGSASAGSKPVVGAVPARRRQAAVAASLLAAGEVALYHRSELRRLVLCARRSSTPGELRQRFRQSTERAARCSACRFTVAGFQACNMHLPQHLGYR